MERLRTPFLLAAILCSLLLVLLETGTALPGILPGNQTPLTAFRLPTQASDAAANLTPDQQQTLAQLRNQGSPPGMGIPALALLDSILLFTIALLGSALVIPARIQGRVQGIATLLFSLLLLGFAIREILLALSTLILMLSLFLSIPFGTIIYLIIYGSFNRAGAAIALSLSMLLKFACAASLFFAQQRFLQSKGLILLLLTSLLANVLISFLYGLVPGILVSITDAIAAIVVGIVVVVWGIFLLVGALVALVKSVQVGRPASA